jgi:hypothetical protein
MSPEPPSGIITVAFSEIEEHIDAALAATRERLREKGQTARSRGANAQVCG